MPNNYAKALVCELELMDYLFYTGRDFGRLVVTEENVISNYALAYALGQAIADSTSFPKSRVKVSPTYSADLGTLPFYITPAIAVRTWTRTRTYNTIPEIYRKRTSPAYGRTFPSYGRYTFVGPESRYLFSVFTSDGELHVPRYIRLGKFKAPARLQLVKEIAVQRASASNFIAVPMHHNDLPHDLPINIGSPVLLGKGHKVLANMICKTDYWRLSEKEVSLPSGERAFIGEGLPIDAHFCARGEMQ